MTTEPSNQPADLPEHEANERQFIRAFATQPVHEVLYLASVTKDAYPVSGDELANHDGLAAFHKLGRTLIRSMASAIDWATKHTTRKDTP